MSHALRRFDLLIFDWDGTLLDSIDWIVTCIKQSAKETGLPVPSDDAARSVIGLSLDGALKRLFPGFPTEGLTPMVDAYRRHFFSRALTAADLFDGVEEALSELRGRGYRLAVATGKARRGLDQALRDTGLLGYFEPTRCADETASKPHPAMLYAILAETQAGLDRAVMIGDSIHDLAMASNAGMAAIGVTCGANSREQLSELKPLTCLGRVAELPLVV
jgi:phosphoglycolate phosphatase